MSIDGGAFADPSSLSQAKAVGQGFNVYGLFDASSLVRPLIDPAKAGTTTFHFRGVDYLVPDYVVGVGDSQSYAIRTVAETREQAQQSISVHAGVGGSYGAFSGEIESDFDLNHQTTAQSYYCYWRSIQSLAVLETNPDLAKAAISDDFAAAAAALPLPLTVQNQTAYFDFFAAYGPFYTRTVTLGGDLSIFNQVAKSNEATSASVELSMKAQFDGLFTTGKLDLSGITKAQWDAYQSGSSTTVKGVGGDTSLVSQLAGVDPWTFSEASAQLAVQWAKSLGTEPGLVDFDLGGVWELIPDAARAAAVQEAWQLFARVMHPKISVQSWSQTQYWPSASTARTPIVIADRIMKPTNPTRSPIGVQVAVLAGNDPTGPHSVLFDTYYTLPMEYLWPLTYDAMWDEVTNDLTGVYDQPGNILLVVTFGQGRNMPPNDGALALFETAGAGATLVNWISTCDPGSQSDTPDVWSASPVVYALAGVFGRGSNTGVEAFASGERCALDLTVHLYRQAYGGQYTIAIG